MLTANRVHKLLDALHQSSWDSRYLLDPWETIFGTPSIASPMGQHPRIWSSENGVIIDLDRPGRSPDDFDITIEKDRLSVAFKPVTESAPSNIQYHVHERGDAGAPAEFRLPFAIQADLTEVSYKNGILRISVTKPAEEQPRKLNVRSA